MCIIGQINITGRTIHKFYLPRKKAKLPAFSSEESCFYEVGTILADEPGGRQSEEAED